ncbi:hypothetical protein [Aeromicrobium sp. UC242_57]|uniref:hypothetical protein n=1 Tax=Aeromicrobium sp. UC242_57 TaxID=3374624 RepID=UPI0037A603B4
MRKLVVAMLTVLLVGSGISAAQAKSKYSVTLAVSATKIELGASVKLTGKVSPKAKGSSVKIQRQYVGGAWKTIATRKLTKAGTYAVSIKPTAGGPTKFRVLKSKSSKRNAGVSTVRSLDVWRWVDLVTTPTDFVIGDGVNSATGSINGTSFGHSLEVDSPGAFLGWDLTNRRCDAFRTYAGLMTSSISNGGDLNIALFSNSSYFTVDGEKIATRNGFQAADDPTYIWRSLVGETKKHLGISFSGIGSLARGIVAEPAVHCNS